ncbi:MAG: hypothetical protein Q4E56_00125 [Pseudomonadota bacterium]|nr:hypothetical protein [Pseudomonadota bacterium]
MTHTQQIRSTHLPRHAKSISKHFKQQIILHIPSTIKHPKQNSSHNNAPLFFSPTTQPITPTTAQFNFNKIHFISSHPAIPQHITIHNIHYAPFCNTNKGEYPATRQPQTKNQAKKEISASQTHTEIPRMTTKFNLTIQTKNKMLKIIFNKTNQQTSLPKITLALHLILHILNICFDIPHIIILIQIFT